MSGLIATVVDAYARDGMTLDASTVCAVTARTVQLAPRGGKPGPYVTVCPCGCVQFWRPTADGSWKFGRRVHSCAPGPNGCRAILSSKAVTPSKAVGAEFDAIFGASLATVAS